MSASQMRAPSLEFKVLGPLEVAVGGRPIAVAGPIRRRLLVGLLTQPNEVVSSDRLIDLLWGDRLLDDPRNSLSTHVSRLRQDLGLAANDEASAVQIERRPAGYMLVVPDGCIDAARFEALVAAVRAGPWCAPEEIATGLQAALDLWRGQAFGEFADDPFVRLQARRLEELRRAATEDLFDAALTAGQHHEVVGEIQAFAERHPFRERPQGQLMLALYRSGRQAEALATYRSFREEFDREMGLVPSADLQRLERDILRDSAELRPAPAEKVQQRAARRLAGLPAPPTRLVGRDDEVAGVGALLAEHRIVTLAGVGGVGKTRLAIATAARLEPRYADGVVWCALDEVNCSSVVASVATAVGVRQHPERPVQSSLLESLRSVELLLVVDNCEHVIDVLAPLVESLVGACPQLTVLATSRERLAVDGEHLWPVEPLAVPAVVDDPSALTAVPSVRLLVDRARAVAPEFTVTAENASSVAAICTQLDGVPLAIELAAARLRSVSPAELADRLGDRLRLLTAGRPTASRRTAGGRHQTLQAVAAWSYDLLTEAERQVFDRVSVFAGGFDLEAAEAVAAAGDIEPGNVADLLTALVDKSMVARVSSGPVTRYRVLEFLRRFGRVRLEQRGEPQPYRRRHACWFVGVAERNEALLYGPSEADAVDRIDREFANLRAAHHWLLSAGHVDDALRLWAALAPYALFRLSDEILTWAQQALAVPGAEIHPRYGQACAMAAACLADVGQRRHARALAEAGLRRVVRDDPAARHGLLALALLELYEGRLDRCLRYSEDSHRLATAVDDRYWAAFSALHEVLALAYGGDTDAALQRAERQRRLAEASGNPTQIAWSLYARGEALMVDDPARALPLLEEAVDVAHSVRNELAEGVALIAVTSLRARRGSPIVALRSFEEVIRLWRRSGNWTQQWTTLRNLAELFARLGHDQPAAVLVAAAHGADTSAPVYGPQARRLAELETLLAQRLGQGRWEAAAGRAATMDADAAVKFALEQLSEARASARS